MSLPTLDEIVLPEHRDQVAAARAFERAACRLARAHAELEGVESVAARPGSTRYAAALLDQAHLRAQEARQALDAADRRLVQAWRDARAQRAASAPAAATPIPPTQETP